MYERVINKLRVLNMIKGYLLWYNPRKCKFTLSTLYLALAELVLTMNCFDVHVSILILQTSVETTTTSATVTTAKQWLGF